MTEEHYEPKGSDYFERELGKMVGYLRKIGEIPLGEDLSSMLEGMVEARGGFLDLGLDLLTELRHYETDSGEWGETKKELLELWKHYERIHAMQNTMNWLYSDHVEHARRELVKPTEQD